MSALTLPSCLITQPVQFEPPIGFPPSIETPDTAMFPLDDVIRLTQASSGMLEFVVDVRDPDVDETLEYQVYVDYVADDARRADVFGPIPPIDRNATEDRTRRRLSFPLPAVRVAGEGCHRIELLVSSAFAIQSREPVHAGDLGTAVWWVATDNGSAVDMRLCP